MFSCQKTTNNAVVSQWLIVSIVMDCHKTKDCMSWPSAARARVSASQSSVKRNSFTFQPTWPQYSAAFCLVQRCIRRCIWLHFSISFCTFLKDLIFSACQHGKLQNIQIFDCHLSLVVAPVRWKFTVIWFWQCQQIEAVSNIFSPHRGF